MFSILVAVISTAADTVVSTSGEPKNVVAISTGLDANNGSADFNVIFVTGSFGTGAYRVGPVWWM